ncbi:FAD-dependent monooxygenase [Streptomyces iconiensis]|uniref:FAD-dependent monooxygenase n=1 Tax=Streptomyces iconiensis TaxID=1384038 RepID=A0ABT6ZZV9_9ACTN|nr:FAD-dependent monooxygenase [Streptomyces iconiensis]MDJ1134141.1 FAD-dependent monooxygenase [Streptomyces iconiensis]
MKAVICGAGIAGLALAHQLGRLGWDVDMVEKAPGPRPQGYMIDFFGAGYEAAEAMGVLPRFRELGYTLSGASFVDTDGRQRASIDYGQFAGLLGGKLLSIMRPDIELALREHLPESVAIRYGTSVAAVEDEPDGVRVALTDGSTVAADLLVGADGIHSTVRALVFGEESHYVRQLGFHTAAFVFDDPVVREAVAGRFCLTDTVGRQMGFYGLRDGRVAAFAVHRTRTHGAPLPEDARAAVREEYGSLGWVAPSALAACPPHSEIYYDQVAQTRLPRWSRGRTVLLGDACYAVSLLAGQGASLGIAGAYVLADQIGTMEGQVAQGAAAEEHGLDGALARYEQVWRPVVEEKQQVARQGTRWFLPESRTRLWARRAAMRAARVPGVDRLVAGAVTGKPTELAELRAAGDASRTPRAQGRSVSR